MNETIFQFSFCTLSSSQSSIINVRALFSRPEKKRRFIIMYSHNCIKLVLPKLLINDNKYKYNNNAYIAGFILER